MVVQRHQPGDKISLRYFRGGDRIDCLGHPGQRYNLRQGTMEGVFNVGPLELVVLAFVGLIVLGPERAARAWPATPARMIRTLREMATGARTQLRDELGPEFADIDLRSLNPRTAITRRCWAMI